MPAIATRGVILDMVGLTGKDPVPEGTAFNQERRSRPRCKRQGNMKIDKGDVVIFYTGWTKLIGKDDKRYGSVEPGLGVEGANYLASLGVAMVGADTWGLEVLPFEDPKKIFYVHQILLPHERHLHPGERERRGGGARTRSTRACSRSGRRASPARCRRSSTRSSSTELSARGRAPCRARPALSDRSLAL